MHLALLVLAAVFLGADPSPTVAPSPSPSPTPAFELHASGANVFIDQATNGPGQIPPEGAAFASGAAAAPMTPFDWFSTNPLLPGVSGEVQYRVTASAHCKRASVDVAATIAAITGDTTNAVFWGEPLLGAVDPIEGRARVQVPIFYPTRAGTDDTSAVALQLPYSVSVHANDNRWRVSGGYVDPAQYDSFVFTQPQFASFDPSLNLQAFETVGPGLSDLKSWNHLAQALPLLGADVYATAGALHVEATDALLPMLQGSIARMTGGNVVVDRGDAGRYSANVIHVQTGGNPVSMPALFGSNPSIDPGAQGPLALSTVGDQSQTIAGIRAFFHPHGGYDALVELGRSWYDASLVARPGSARYGDFEHVSLARNFNANDTAEIEYYRMDPRYGTLYLPYGEPLNVWGIAWAYPGPWLKGSYQLVTDAWGGSNREGPRVRAAVTRGPWTAAAAAYDYRQIEPSTYQNLTSTGFVEVDYLVLAPGDLTRGRTRGVQTYVAYAGHRDTLSFDYANDSQHRDGTAANGIDDVAMQYPQVVLADQHKVSDALAVTGGYARYHPAGTWSQTPVDGRYGVGFVGAEWDLGRFGQLLVQLRRYGVNGVPSIPGGPAPTLRGTGLVVDHHFQI